MRVQLCSGLLAIASATFSPLAYAAHPLVTDDTGTQGEGNTQLEANTDWQNDKGSRNRIATVTYTYGAHSSLDLIANLPKSLSGPRGLNDVSIGVKWRFWEHQGSSLAVKPEWTLPSGDVGKGLGNGKAGAALTLLATHETESWTFHANIGLQMNRYADNQLDAANRRTVWRSSVAAAYLITPKTIVAVDLGLAKNVERTSSTHPAFALIGVIYAITPDVDIDVGIKSSLNSAEVDRQIGGGLTIRF